MELDIKTKAHLILAGRIAIAAVCVLVTVMSLSFLGLDQWRLLWESMCDWARDLPLFLAAFLTMSVGTVVLWVLFFQCKDEDARMLLLPMCFLPPVHFVLSIVGKMLMFSLWINPILFLLLVPAMIVSFTSRKRFLYLGPAFLICAAYLVLTFLCCAYLLMGVTNRGN